MASRLLQRSAIVGWVADEIGLATALQALIIIPIVAALTTLFLPGQEAFGRLYPD